MLQHRLDRRDLSVTSRVPLRRRTDSAVKENFGAIMATSDEWSMNDPVLERVSKLLIDPPKEMAEAQVGCPCLSPRNETLTRRCST
jgi:hypothetical protein